MEKNASTPVVPLPGGLVAWRVRFVLERPRWMPGQLARVPLRLVSAYLAAWIQLRAWLS